MLLQLRKNLLGLLHRHFFDEGLQRVLGVRDELAGEVGRVVLVLAKGLDALPSNIPIGPWVNGLNDNQQIEAVTLLEPNTLAVFAENPASGEENIRGALEFYPGGPRRLMTRNFRVAPRPPFAVTSAATAPEGDVLLLERRASLAGGVGIELRRVAPGAIAENTNVTADVLAELSYQDANIDNMEGLALRRGPKGETLIYMMSDDNYSPLQRTLLLMFEWKR